MRFTTLPRYRGETSLVPYSGGVPSHWTCARWKSVLRLTAVPAVAGSNDPYLALEHVDGWTGQSHPIRGDGQDGIRFDAGDILFGKLRPYLAKVVTAPTNGVCVGEFWVLRPRRSDVLSQFMAYLLRSKPVIDWIDGTTFGARMPRASWSAIGATSVAVPPADEQAAIVKYLTHANARIDKAIAAKRRLIALLREEELAVIAEAVTGGRRWLAAPSEADLPSSWVVEPFVRVVIERADYRGATPEKVDFGVRLVTAKNVRPGWIDYETSREFVREDQYEEIMRRGLPKIGDILLTMEAPVGNVALVDREDVAFAQRVVRFRPDRRRLLPEFAVLAMNSSYFQSQILERATGSTALGIKASKLPQLLLARPSVQEQQRIIERVGSDSRSMIEARARTAREVSLLEEFRTRLIADVVTGQVDVREIAASLPEVEPGASGWETAAGDGAEVEELAEMVGADGSA